MLVRDAALAKLVGRGSMAVARRLPAARTGGVIVCGHTLGAEQARFQVGVLARWFDFIHHDELLDRLERPRGRPFCLLTFDDGKRSNATELAPVLEQLGVPAVFYVVTRFLSEGGVLWFDQHDALVRALGQAPPGLKLGTLKSLPLAALRERLERACTAHGVAGDPAAADVGAMTWDDARRLARRGFTIGAHGLTHAIVTNEPDETARDEIGRSIAEVGMQIGTPCVTYAFPNGNHTASLARYAYERGINTVMTTRPTWVNRSSPAWRLPRVQLFGGQSRAMIEMKLAAAATGCLLADPDGVSGRFARAMPA